MYKNETGERVQPPPASNPLPYLHRRLAVTNSTALSHSGSIKDEARKEKKRAYHREWMRRHRASHPEKHKEICRRYLEKNRDKVRERQRKRYEQNRETVIAQVSEYARRNRAKINQRRKVREMLDPERAKQKRREAYLRYRAKDKERRAKKRSEFASYMRHKRNSDPAFLVADRLRRRINSALSSQQARKSGGLIDVSGCSPAELAAHIEKQFLPGMSWENRRQWHIDHIVPCSAFDLTDPSQQAVAFHYTNLRPVWAAENQRKRASIPGGQRQLFWTPEHVEKAKKKLKKKATKGEPL